MTTKHKLFLSFFGILVLSAASAWIVHPKGGRISLKKLKINYEQTFKLRLGLDLQGGSHLVYQADFKGVEEKDKIDSLNGIREIIERRVNSFGVSEPQVLASGKDRLIVELPGVKDINDAIDQIGKTPTLDFRIRSPNTPTVEPNEKGEVSLSLDDIYLKTGLSGSHLKKATVELQSGGGLNNEPVVKLEFNDEGAKLFEKITKENLKKPVAIFLDGQIISEPVVQDTITSGTAIINGDFTVKAAKELAVRLNSGALPVPIKLISQQNVGASLGKDSVQKSILAGLIGLALIVLFMVFFYRFPGFLAVCALLVYALVSLMIFKIGISFTAVALVGVFFFLGLTVNANFGILAFVAYLVLAFLKALSPVTLTLAGIAGFILSIGMAVDANILIFERLKEEIRSGKDIAMAVEDGFKRAWLSIRDSNVSSLITTVILYWFGTPSIKGFAVTLGVGILISMFTAITVTRTFLKLFVGNNILTHPWLFGVSKTNDKK